MTARGPQDDGTAAGGTVKLAPASGDTPGSGVRRPQRPPQHSMVPVHLHFRRSYLGRSVVWVIVGGVGMLTIVATILADYLFGVAKVLGLNEVWLLGHDVFVVRWRPSSTLLWGAFLTYALIAVTAVIVEQVAARRRIPKGEIHSRAALDLVRSRDTTHPGQVSVTALIPAHNEGASLGETLAALYRQSRPPERVIVVADNCTDDTVAVARRFGAEVFETVGNTHKKGGALNQALAYLLPTARWYDAILVMDADTSLSEEFIEVAAARLDEDASLSAVGGVFHGEGGHGLVGQLQRNEYQRYATQITHRRGRVFVLTGTASMFRADALALVAATRGSELPGHLGEVYDTEALTEDNEITIALKSLGARILSPGECTVVTELMPSWRDLWRQRERWQRGALENVSAYGFTSATIRYWGQQIGIGYGTVALWTAYFVVTVWFLAIDNLVLFPFWLGITFLYVVERVGSVWKGGWKARLIALPLVIEVAYDAYLQVIFVKALIDIVLGRDAGWNHVRHGTEELA